MRPLRGHDAGALLPAMLQRKEPVVGQQRGVWMPINAENAALMFWSMRIFHRSGSGHQTRQRKIPCFGRVPPHPTLVVDPASRFVNRLPPTSPSREAATPKAGTDGLRRSHVLGQKRSLAARLALVEENLVQAGALHREFDSRADPSQRRTSSTPPTQRPSRLRNSRAHCGQVPPGSDAGPPLGQPVPAHNQSRRPPLFPPVNCFQILRAAQFVTDLATRKIASSSVWNP